MIYADTGFLVSLYLPEVTSAQAESLMATTSEPVLMSDLTWLEFRNALNRAVFLRRLDLAGRDEIWQQAVADEHLGILQSCVVDAAAVRQLAHSLSDRYTPVKGARTLDLLHVAAALLLSVDEFWSFDMRQRQVAMAEGLQVRP